MSLARTDRTPDELLGLVEPEDEVEPEGPVEYFSEFQTGLREGMSTAQLARIFDISAETAKRRLQECPVKGKKGRAYLYDLKTAAAYIVRPVTSIDEILKALKKGDLPAALQKEIWAARKSRQEYLERAGDLWHTDDVVETFARVFASIKSSVQLWPDTVERQEGLTGEQRALLVELGDQLQDDIYAALKKAAARSGKRASVKDFEDELRESR